MTVDLPLAADPAMHEANSRIALLRYMQDGDPSDLVLPDDATIVTIKILTEEQVDAALVGLPAKPTRGARVLAELQEQVRRSFDDDADAIEVGRAVLAAAADAGGDEPEDLVRMVARVILRVRPDDDEEARAEAVGREVLLARRGALGARLRAELPEDDAQAVEVLEAWSRDRGRALVDAAIVRIVDFDDPDPAVPGDDGRRVYDFDARAPVSAWLAQIKPVSYSRTVLAELAMHVERVHSLGKARRRPLSPPSGSTASETAGRPGPVTAAPAPPVASGASAAAASGEI